MRRVPVEHISEGWVLDALNDRSALQYVARATRRLLDLAFGAMGLVAPGVVLPFVALAICLDDRGTFFYSQVRSGRGGRPFRVIKFRAMCLDAEKDGRPRWACENDDRVTRVGRFLREVRLDELPQVINVLRGEMCIVGPRPERPGLITELEKQIHRQGAKDAKEIQCHQVFQDLPILPSLCVLNVFAVQKTFFQ